MLRRFCLAALFALGTASCSSDAGVDPAVPPPGHDGGVDSPTVDVQEAAIEAEAAPHVAALSFATFNTHQLFDTTCDSGNCAPGDFELVLTQEQFDARIDQVATAIRGLHATAVSVQEIETVASMEALTARLSDLYPTAIMAETGAPGSLDVAVFGAGTLLEIRKHRGVPITRPDGTSTSFSREFLEVHMDLAGLRIVVFSAHFRSKNNDDPGRRQAEARAARDIVIMTAQELPEAVVLLGGDLNDTPGSPPLLDIESAASMLRAAKDRPIDQVSTYSWNGELQAIDHIFLETTSRGVYVPGSARAVRDGPGQGLGGSDHAALQADFDLR
ncbi:MAG: endonuclease/exonuclease/phosphatase family protein [Deltaproteobacteria bacterium]|nr:endonuclease/exonuclease/phosphatase family protein [Deltaproteobacteria bacterium]